MKTPIDYILIALALLSTLNAQLSTVFAQGTAFTYQGQLQNNGAPASGNYNLTFTLFNTNTGGTAVAGPVTNNGVVINNGLFTVLIDFGSGVFTGATNWLQIGVATNGVSSFTTLTPRQQLTPTPYAIYAENANAAGLSGTIPAATFGGTYGNAVILNNAGNSFSGNGGGLTNVNTATLGGLGANQFWHTTGNSNTVAGVNFLGTADNLPLELRVNGARALRVEPGGTNAPNVVWGHTANSVAAGVVGAVIGGGGGSSVTSGAALTNRVTDAHGVVGGGLGNVAGDDDGDPANARYATVGGGVNNTAGSFSATIAGGYQNTIGPAALDGAIGGGYINTVAAPHSTISGGAYNTTGTNSYFATIGGGGYHSIGTNSSSTTISGGYNNSIGNNTLDAAIGGGSYNVIGTNSPYSTIAGGRINSIGDNAIASAIGGGFENTVRGGSYHVIGGGYLNLAGPSGIYATNSSYGSVGGGYGNNAEGNYATAPGGYLNWALGQYSFAAGRQAKAMSDGTFVWADSQSAEFDSSRTNQFAVRANGGVQFVTSGAGMTLDGQAVATVNVLNNLNAANITSGTLADIRLSANVALRAGGNFFNGLQAVTGVPEAQLILQNSNDHSFWYLYDDDSRNLVFQPSTFGDIGGYIYKVDGSYHQNSDLRLKRDITALGGVLDRVLQLRPVSYHFRSAPEGTPLTLGLIAQEVEPLFPEVVGERDGMKSLAYSELVPVAIGAIQELNQKMEAGSQTTEIRSQRSEERIQKLEAENAELKQRLAALEEVVLSQRSN